MRQVVCSVISDKSTSRLLGDFSRGAFIFPQRQVIREDAGEARFSGRISSAGREGQSGGGGVRASATRHGTPEVGTRFPHACPV